MTSLRRPLTQLAAFAVAGAISAVLVVNTLSVPVQGTTVSHTAEFTGVEGLRSGNDVTLAGVRIGRVDDVEFSTAGSTSTAVVGFSVQSAVPIPANVTAEIRYGDMLGARYLALVSPIEPSGTLGADSMIGLDRTTPPVDLTALVNGFKPLFDAIEPEQVETLARSIVDAFSGEAATIDSLLAHVATVTRGLADNDRIISDLIADLDAVLQTMTAHGDDISRLITGLTEMSQVVADRNASVITVLDDGAWVNIHAHFGRSIIAVNSASAAISPSTVATPLNFQTLAPALPLLHLIWYVFPVVHFWPPLGVVTLSVPPLAALVILKVLLLVSNIFLFLIETILIL